MTSSSVSKRLFIGGLANDISEAEIVEKFSRFGKVSDLSVKHRKEDSGIIHKSFAHLNIEGEETNIKKCFAAYQNTKWKGSVLTLQYAKESFLNKLIQERKEEKLSKEEVRSQDPTPKPVSTWEPPKFDKPQGSAVPGTPIPGKPDWIVGKYGRVLPVLKLKKSSKLRVVKHDPSKLCHTAKVFKENVSDLPANATCNNLTWEINQPDSDIVKKMKGIFPMSKVQQKRKINPLSTDLSLGDKSISGDFPKCKPPPKKVMVKKEEFEIVPLGAESSTLKGSKRNIESSKFDSDVDSETECAISVPQTNTQRKKIKTELKVPAKEASKEKREMTKNIELNESVNVNPSLVERGRWPLLNSKNRNCKRGTESEEDSDENNDSVSTSMISNGSFMKNPNSGIQKKKIKKSKRKRAQCEDSDEEDSCPVPKFAGLSMLGSPEKKIGLIGGNVEGDSSFRNNLISKKKLENSFGELSEDSFSPFQSPKFNAVNDSILVIKKKKKKSKKKKKCDDDSSSDEDCLVPKFGGLDMLCTQPHRYEHGNKSFETFHVPSENSKSPVVSVQVTQIVHDQSESSNTKDVVASRDSDSSAGTDEIILRRKSQHTHKSDTSTTRTGFSLPIRPSSVETGNNLLKSDQNLLLSELFASAPDTSETTLVSKTVPFKSSPSDSYDSDLDSNDFELVAKKLAKKTSKVFPKENNSNDPLLKASPSTPNILSAKPKKKKLFSNGDESSPQEVQIKKPQKQLTGDERRLQAVKERMKQKQQQAQIVQAALHNVDSQDNKKRKVFSSDEEEEEEKEDGSSMTVIGERENKKKSTDTKQLFDSDSASSDEDDIDMFQSRPHLEGKKGEKLMKLERRFGDSRFKLDAKFAESDSEEEPAIPEQEPGQKEVADELAAERDANLKVLEKVVGKATLDQFSQKIKRNTKQMIDMNTVRFDPTKLVLPASTQDTKSKKISKLEIKDERNEKTSTKVSDKKDKKIEEKLSVVSSEDVKSAASEEDKMAEEGGTTETKGEEAKTKTVKAADKQCNDNATKSKVTVASSLINLFKAKPDEDSSDEEPAGFSLLDQFDKAGKNPKLRQNMKDQGRPAAPLSALFKTSSDLTEVKTSQGMITESSSDDSENSSSSDEESEENEKKDGDEDSEDDMDDKASSEEDESLSNDDSQDENDEKDDGGKLIKDGLHKTKGKKLTSVSDLLGNESGSDQNDSEAELEPDKGELDDDASDDKVKLNKADPLDIRYTREKWLERWNEIRPVIVKIYKKKHKDAVKNKRTQTDMKRRKEFSKNTKRFAWFKNKK